MNFKYRIQHIKELQEVLFFINKEYKSEYNKYIGFSFINNELYFYKSFSDFNSLDFIQLSSSKIREIYKPVIVISL